MVQSICPADKFADWSAVFPRREICDDGWAWKLISKRVLHFSFYVEVGTAFWCVHREDFSYFHSISRVNMILGIPSTGGLSDQNWVPLWPGDMLMITCCNTIRSFISCCVECTRIKVVYIQLPVVVRTKGAHEALNMKEDNYFKRVRHHWRGHWP